MFKGLIRELKKIVFLIGIIAIILIHVTVGEILEKYEAFLYGNATVDYEGEQLTYSELLWEIYDCYDYCDVNYMPNQSFMLTDYNRDGLPELNVEFHSLSYGPQLFSLEWKENSLKIRCSHRDGASAIFTLFEKGYIKSVRGLSATRTTIEYISPEGEKAAKYGMVYSDFNGELTAQTVQKDYQRFLDEGYQYVYVTSDDICTWEQFEVHMAQFERDYCGREVKFYEIEEDSIQNNLKWNK